MQLYFNSIAAGGSGDGDFGNAANFWTDNGNTIPAGAIPASTDDVEINGDNVLTGSGVANNITASSGQLSGGTITVYGTVTGIGINGVILTAASGPLLAIGCSFTVDPGGDISSSSGCGFYGGGITHNITDDGTAIWSQNTISGNLHVTGGVLAGAPALPTGGTTFSGQVTVDGYISGGTFTNQVYCVNLYNPGQVNTLDLSGATLNLTGVIIQNLTGLTAWPAQGYINWSGVTGVVGTIDATINFNADPTTFKFPNDNTFTITNFLPDNSATNPYIQTGTGSGTLVSPAESDVRSGVAYGVSGNGSTGSYSGGGGTVGYGG